MNTEKEGTQKSTHTIEITVTRHHDPGHSWFAVPIAAIVYLAIEKSISLYSYVDANFCYLEEDSDAEKFFIAAEKNEYIKIKMTKEILHPQDCFIRDLPRWRASRIRLVGPEGGSYARL